MRLMATIQLDRTGLEYDHICCFIGRAAKYDGKRKGAETNTVWWDSELVTASRKNIPVTWDIPGCATCQCCGNSPSRGGSKMPWSAGFFPSSPSIPHSVIITPPFWRCWESRASSLLESGGGASQWVALDLSAEAAAAWVGMGEVRPMPGPQWGKTESHGALGDEISSTEQEAKVRRYGQEEPSKSEAVYELSLEYYI